MSYFAVTFKNIASIVLLSSISLGAFGTDEAPQRTTDFGWADDSQHEKQIAAIDRLGRRHFGQPLRGDFSDLDLLQRIADRKLIKESDTFTLQATGAVLGDVLVNELNLVWKIYQDQRGRSRALCVAKSEHCLFPVTMLSRRLEVGLAVNVKATYDDAAKKIKPFLPDYNAYDGKQADPSPKPSWTRDRKEKPNTIPIR
ncbi:DUF3806 domain-containing protein [Aurantivibrio plasticivorans]